MIKTISIMAHIFEVSGCNFYQALYFGVTLNKKTVHQISIFTYPAKRYGKIFKYFFGEYLDPYASFICCDLGVTVEFSYLKHNGKM